MKPGMEFDGEDRIPRPEELIPHPEDRPPIMSRPYGE